MVWYMRVVHAIECGGIVNRRIVFLMGATMTGEIIWPRYECIGRSEAEKWFNIYG